MTVTKRPVVITAGGPAMGRLPEDPPCPTGRHDKTLCWCGTPSWRKKNGLPRRPS